MLRGIITSFILLLGKTNGYDPYPYNPNIHTIGNHGFMGRVHAEIAPLFIEFTERAIYDDHIRQRMIEELGKDKSILDIGCGVGISTSNAKGSLGIDTSMPMIEKAKILYPDKSFALGNGEHWECDKGFDAVTTMFCFHEIPQQSRKHLIAKCLKYARERVVIVDISPNYIPNKHMLSGEPYLPDYLENIRDDLCDFEETVLVSDHVHKWSIDI
tara:strand:+ start:102 stop:743 length:642 start_codon:yes stop_codon:yes gene_type:complete